MPKLLVVLSFFVAVLRAGDCTLAIVEWEAPSTYNQADEPKTTPTKDIGCITENETSIIIVHQLSGGTPKNILVLPKGVVTKLTPLMEKAEEPTSFPQNLPKPNFEKGPTDKLVKRRTHV